MQEIHRFEEIDERIELFLKGKMNPTEAESFKLELKDNKELRNRAKVVALMVKAMKESSSKQDERIINEITGKQKKSRIITLSYRITAIAACLCIIFSITDYQFRKSNTLDLAVQYSGKYLMDESSFRDRESAIQNELFTLSDQIKEKQDLTKIISRLDSMFVTASSEGFNEYTSYHEQIGKCLVVAYLQNNERGKAIKLLEDLIEEYPDKTIFKTMLEEIKSIKGIF
jgi:hypothetical protein